MADWSKLKILILDSDPEFMLWAAKVLSRGKGAEVQTSSSSVDAFQMLRQFRADIGLVDLGLPQVGGIDFLRWIRNADESPNAQLPVVLSAVKADAHMLRQACEIGINSFMKKPIDEDRFLRRLLVTVTKPSWFVIGSDYFGPDRRKESLPFEGEDRRQAENAQGQATLPEPPPPPPEPSRPATAAAASPGSGPSAPATTSRARSAAPQAAASPAERPSVRLVEPAGTQAAARPKAREWDEGDLPDAPATGAESRTGLSEEDIAAPAEKAKDDESWKEALEEQAEKESDQAAKELAIDMAPILASHQDWLRSGGREGQRATLRKTDLSGADLINANLADADLQEVILCDAQCREANFQGADMRYADLSNIDAVMSNMGVARLRHANMSLAQLNGANLRGTDLAGATLRGAVLDEADFSGSNLLSTDLRETDLSGVRGLTQLQIAKARADSSTRLPSGLRLPRREK